ncbi:MAG: tRNA uridine-5-carboxymethylaminomethyl(34) synthesis GTPase MnmE [Verrucomicrobia bacterium]|nr:tRNA uridine-5-carboxymethylaminomethyl(34) synthesis GTPase MnmE [Verrucomicrobiota bacterium]
MDVQDTIVAAATPAGRSALAVVRIDGPLAYELSAKGLGRSAPLPERRAAAAVWRDLRGEPVDQVVAVRWAAGRSFTGGDTLELTCHGNPLLVRRIVEDLLARGARMAEPGEFTRRAYLAGRMDLTQAEGVADLIHANGERALEAARRLLAGELGRLVAAWSERLLSTLATLEAHIDFPEEDLPAEDPRGPAAALAALASELSEYARTARHDAALRGGLRVAVVGAPNAGKSSLLNALTGAARALVSPEAGTTRDWIEAPVGGLPLAVTAVDTAGLREGGGAVERAGMERSLEQAESAHFLLLVVDASAPPPSLPPRLTTALRPGRCLIVANKSDLPQHPALPSFMPNAPRVKACLLDSRDGERLRAALAAALVDADLAPGADELVVSVRHADALRRAAGALEDARSLLNAPARTELAAERCREALDALGEIVGRIDNERMLDKLFASFCIGK